MVGSSRLEPLLEMAAWLIRLRTVNECFVLSSTDLAALFAEEWPADYSRLKVELPAWILFYVVAGYEFFPEERVATYLDEITTITMRLGLAPGGSVAGLSARDILKTVQRPSQEPYWKLRPKGSCEDVFFLTTQEKIPGLVEIVQGIAATAGYPATDLGVYVQPIVQGTSYHVEFSLFYDPANSAEAERVRNLSRAATKALLDAGAFFSRPHGENARMIMNRDGASVEMLKQPETDLRPEQHHEPGEAVLLVIAGDPIKVHEAQGRSKMALEEYAGDMNMCCRCSTCKFIPLQMVKGFKHANVCPSTSRYNFHFYSAAGD